MRIYMVRHGYSQSQNDPSVLLGKDDAEIELHYPVAGEQADAAGAYLKRYLTKLRYAAKNGAPVEKIEIVRSPYKRVEQTTAHLIDKLGYAADGGLIDDVKVHPALHERLEGVVSGLRASERDARYPKLQAQIKHGWANNCVHDVVIPGGENLAQVEKRLDDFMPFIEDAQKRGVTDLIISAHSTVNRVLTKKLMGLSWDQFYDLKVAGNCHIHMFELKDGKTENRGYIHAPAELPSATFAGAAKQDHTIDCVTR
jgi:broad specificity phosphatase PhoE